MCWSSLQRQFCPLANTSSWGFFALYTRCCVLFLLKKVITIKYSKDLECSLLPIPHYPIVKINGKTKSPLHMNELSSESAIFLFFLSFFKIYFIIIFCLFLPYIDMNQPCIYMCSPSWTPLPPPSPSHPSGSSQCTSPEHLSHASNLGWWSVSHLIIYMFWCSSWECTFNHNL